MRRTIPAAAILLVVILGAAALLAYTTAPVQPATGREIWRVESLNPQDAPATPTIWKGIEIASALVQPMPALYPLEDSCLNSIGSSEAHIFLRTSGHAWAIGNLQK